MAAPPYHLACAGLTTRPGAIPQTVTNAAQENTRTDPQGNGPRTAPGLRFLDTRTKLRIATWNVLTLRKTGAAELLIKELQRYQVAIAGICEARWTGTGETIVDNHSILWSGHETRGRGGVALVLSPPARQALIEWQPIGDRILKARFRHRFGKLSIVVAYAPTDVAEEEIKDAYFNQLEATIASVPPHDLSLLLTDANATISESSRTVWPGLIGNAHVDQVTNDNGTRLLEMCQSTGLCVADSWFPRRRIHHWTWYSNDGNTKKALDHILISARWRNAVTNCRVYRGAQLGNTDHRILIATIRLRLKAGPSSNKSTRLDQTKLRDPAIAERFAVAISNRYTALAQDQHGDWDSFKEEVQASALHTLRRERPPPRRPWISTESLDLIEERRKARLIGKMRRYRRLNSLRNASLKADKERYWSNMADTLEAAARRNDHATIYRTLRDLRDKPRRKVTQVKDASGELLSTKDECLNRWK